MNENKTREAILGLVEDVRELRKEIQGFEKRLKGDLDTGFTKVKEMLDMHTQQLQNITRVVAGPMANAINKIEEHFNLEKTNFFPKNKKTKVRT
jgi:hypothetical protein